MIGEILTVALPAIATGALGYCAGRIHLEHWKDASNDLAKTVANLRQDLANTRQSYLRQLDSKDSAIRTLNHRLVPLEAREERRLSQLRSIASKGAIAMHAKRKEARKVAVAKTLAALPSLISKPIEPSVGAAAKEGGSASL